MRKKRIDKKLSLCLVLLALLFLFALYFAGTALTPAGYFSLQTIFQKDWNFSDSNEYSYDSVFISISNEQAKLIATTTDEGYNTMELQTVSVVTATLHKFSENSNESNDESTKTNEIEAIDGNFVNLQKSNRVLDVTFNTTLDNGDVISIYILHGNNVNTDVYLCDANTACTAPGYGLVNFNETEGWYNITISNLPSPIDTLGIDPPNHVKIDYVTATRTTTVNHSHITTTYPATAEIETADFSPIGHTSWGTFSSIETLNNQTIIYLYSIDSGETWTDVPADDDLSAVEGNSIKVKAIFSSNQTATPLLESFSIGYTKSTAPVDDCTENWTAQYGKCWKDNTKRKFYEDVNSCATSANIPADNNTLVTCDYCQDTNCSGSLIKKKISSINNSLIVDDSNNTNTKLEITSKSEMEAVTISILEYAHNIKNVSPIALPIHRYLEIESDQTTNISSVKIIIYYTDAELAAAGVDEQTLKIHYYNETSQLWDELVSVVNVSGNYVYAIVPHLSLYGVFGDQTPPDSSVVNSGGSSGGSSGGGSGSGSSGGDGGSSRISTTSKQTIESKEQSNNVFQQKAQTGKLATESEKACNYVVEISLPTEISFLGTDRYDGEISNQGDCTISEFKFDLDPSLQETIAITIPSKTEIQPGSKTKFTLIRKQEKQVGIVSWLTGSSILTNIQTISLEGNIVITSLNGPEIIDQRKLPVKIMVEDTVFGVGKSILGLNIMLLLLIVFGLTFWKKHTIRGKLEKYTQKGKKKNKRT